MAKQQQAIVRFDGGIQTAYDQRDIPEEAAANAQNVAINTPGVLKVSGKSIDYSIPILSGTNPSVDFEFGYGLHNFSSDHLIDLGTLRLAVTDSITDSTVSGYNDTFNTEGEYDFVQLKFSTDHGLTEGDLITISGTGGTYDGDYNTRPTATYYNGEHRVEKIVDADEIIIDATSSSDSLTYNVTASIVRTGQSQFVNDVIQNGQQFHILTQDKNNLFNTSLNSNYINLGSDTSNVRPAFHQARGGLRICDGNFDNTNNAPKILHYIPETKLGWGAEINTTLSAGWRVSNSEIKRADNNIANINTAPDAALAGNANGARILYHTTTQTAHTELGTQCGGVVWRVFTNTAEGEFQALIDGDEHRAIQFGHSWIYDGYQEGPVATLVGYAGYHNDRTWFQLVPGSSSSSLEVDCSISMSDIAIDNPRITGCKLYITGVGSKGGEAVTDNWDDDTGDHLGGFTIYDDPLYLAEVDFTKGIKSHDGDYEAYTGSSFTNGWTDTRQDSDNNSELITDGKNRDFTSNSDWVEFSPDGTNLAAFDEDGSPAYMQITGTTSTTAREGASLPIASLTADSIVAGKEYTISAQMWWDDGSDPSAGTIFYFGIGSGVSSSFAVSATAAGTSYSATVVAEETGIGDLLIYKKGNVTEVFNVDAISIKESGAWAKTKEIIISDYPNLSFRMLAGYKHNTPSVFAKYKTSCMVDNRVYIGNVQQDVKGHGTAEIFEDRVLVSAIGANGAMPDVFPAERVLEITSNDGDQIVKLEAFKEKIVQLNRNKAIIINVYGPGDMETVESTWPHAGINNPGSSTVFEGGVLWANEFGCWMYNGETVTNLIVGKIDTDEWNDFIYRGESNKCLVEYCDIDKTIVIFNGSANPNADNDTYIFNILTEGWVRGKNLITSGYGGSVSNFINDFGKLRYIDNASDTESGESFNAVNVVSQHAVGEKAVSIIGPFNNAWTNTSATDLLIYLNTGSSSDNWVAISEATLTWANNTNFPNTVGEPPMEYKATLIAEALNNYNGANPQFTAEVVSYDHPLVPDSFVIDMRAKEVGTAHNSTFGTHNNNSDSAGNYTSLMTAMKFDNASQNDTIGDEGSHNAGLSLTTVVEGEVAYNQPVQITPPHGGVAATADSIVFEVDRLSQSTSGYIYTLRFQVRDHEDTIVAPIDVSVTTSGSINTEEKIIDEFVNQLQSASSDKINRRASSLFTVVRCSAIDGTVRTGSSYHFFKITTNTLNVASGSTNAGQYYKITDVETSVDDQILFFKEFIPTKQVRSVSGFNYLTRDQDFGSPGTRKKIYKVYVTYKCTGDSTVSVSYKSDQKIVEDTGFLESANYSGQDEDSTLKTLDDTDGELAIAELKPVSSIQNIYSFQLQFIGSNVPSDFEINDITIVYRPKRVK